MRRSSTLFFLFILVLLITTVSVSPALASQQIEVTANVQPSDQVIAGDYVVSVLAQPQDGPSKSADFRITVLTSTL